MRFYWAWNRFFFYSNLNFFNWKYVNKNALPLQFNIKRGKISDCLQKFSRFIAALLSARFNGHFYRRFVQFRFINIILFYLFVWMEIEFIPYLMLCVSMGIELSRCKNNFNRNWLSTLKLFNLFSVSNCSSYIHYK